MATKYLILVLLLNKLYFMTCQQCSVSGKKMDCSNKNMVDCPDVNANVTELIMDNNKLSDLKTDKCDQWTNLQIFRASNNQLVNLGNYIVSSHLAFINVSHNQLISVQFFGDKLVTIDVSYNKLNDITCNRLSSLRTLILGHNTINPSALKLILFDNIFPSLSTLDLSYNRLNTVPINFMSFFPSFLYEVNLSGNRIKIVYFTLFTYKSHNPIKLNLAYNRITTFVVNNPPSLEKLDLSHNKLSYIDLPSIKLLVVRPLIDLSYNPFNCSCKYIPPFVDFMTKHQDSFSYKTETNCDKGPNIFNRKCLFMFAQSTRLTHFYWIIPVVGVLIVLTILCSILMVRYRRSHYTEIGTSDRLPAISYIFTDWLRSSSSNPASSFSDLGPLNCQHLDFEEKLVILCTKADKKWVTKDIVQGLQVKKIILVSKVSELPPSDYILIVVNGNHSITDRTLKSNVDLAIRCKEVSEIRLLIKEMPTKEALNGRHALTKLVNSSVIGCSYFKFENEYPSITIDSLKAWMNI